MDASIGIRLINDLKSAFTGRRDIFYKTAEVGGLDILQEIIGYHSVYIIDALKSSDGIPGEVKYFDLNNYKSTFYLDNLHDVYFPDSIKLAKKLGMEVSDEISVIGIEIYENLEFSNNLSDELAKKYPEILLRVYSFIKTRIERFTVTT